MVHKFAAATLQLRNHTRGPEPPSPLGPQASGRSRLAVRVSYERTVYHYPKRRYPMEPPQEGARGNVRPDCRRGRDFYHLCCRLHFLHRQERHGSTAARCPPRSNLPDDLLAFKQSDDSLGIAVAESRESALFRALLAS